MKEFMACFIWATIIVGIEYLAFDLTTPSIIGAFLGFFAGWYGFNYIINVYSKRYSR